MENEEKYVPNELIKGSEGTYKGEESREDNDLNTDGSKTVRRSNNQKSNKNKKKIIALIIGVVFLLGSGFGFTKYNEYTKTHYPKGAKIGDISVEGKTIEEAKELVDKKYSSDDMKIIVKSQNKYIGEVNLGKPYDVKAIYKDMSISNSNQNVSKEKLDMDMINKNIESLDYNAELQKGKDATIVRDGNKGYRIEKHTPSKIINKAKVKTALIERVNSGNLSEFNLDDFIEDTVKIKEDNVSLKKRVEDLNKKINRDIVLEIKKGTEVDVPKDIIAKSVDVKGNVNTDLFISWLNEVNQNYATYSDTVEFTTTSGSKMTLANNGNYGWSMDVYTTATNLTNEISENTGKNKIKASTVGNVNDDGKAVVSGDYVEIDLNAQHMWVYKNGKAIVSTPVITGLLDSRSPTPSGIFKVQYKQTPSVLKGKNFDGTDYESPVNYWIPFNGAIGIHDSDWQKDGSYGGDSYKTVGSKGCVNTPPSVMKKVFDNVYEGETVIVHGNIYNGL